MHSSSLRNSIISIVTDLWQKVHIVTKKNALFNKKLNFLINCRSVQINLHKGVPINVLPQIIKKIICRDVGPAEQISLLRLIKFYIICI